MKSCSFFRSGLAAGIVGLLGFFVGMPWAGSLQAQDVDAVQKRLLRAVKHRELSMEQATMMMRVLRDSAHQGQADRGRPPQGRRDQARRQNEGRPMQPNRQGRPRQDSDRRSDRDRGQDLEQRFDQLMQAIDYSVRAGQISEEEAGHQRREAERWMENQHHEGDHHEGEHDERVYHDRMEEFERMFAQRIREIDEAVRSGQISEEEANRYRRITERWFESQHREGGHDDEGRHEREHDEREHDERAYHEELERMFAQRMREIDEAIRSGELSEEEADHHRGEVERWFELQHREGGHDEREHDEREHDERAHHGRMEDLERAFAQRMRAFEEAVRAGEISEEEANRYRMELERWMESQHREGRQDEHEHEHEHEHGPDHDREEHRDGEPREAEAARKADK